MSKKLRITSIFLFATVLISIFYSITFSQNPSSNGISPSSSNTSISRIEGIISAVNEKTLELSDGAIKIDLSNTVIKGVKIYKTSDGGLGGARVDLPISALIPGMYISAIRYRGSAEHFQPNTVEIRSSPKEGQITAKVLDLNQSEQTLNLLNQQVLVPDTAPIQSSGEQIKNINFSNLQTNKFAAVQLTIEQDSLTAIQVLQVDTPPSSEYIVSPITEVNKNSFKLLNNLSINKNGLIPRSALEPTDFCKTLDLSSLKTGMLVTIFPRNIKYDAEGNIQLKDQRLLIRLSDEGLIQGVPEEINTETKTIKINNQELFFNDKTLIGKDPNTSGSLNDLSTKENVFLIYKVIDGKLIIRYIELVKPTGYEQGYNPCKLRTE